MITSRWFLPGSPPAGDESSMRTHGDLRAGAAQMLSAVLAQCPRMGGEGVLTSGAGPATPSESFLSLCTSLLIVYPKPCRVPQRSGGLCPLSRLCPPVIPELAACGRRAALRHHLGTVTDHPAKTSRPSLPLCTYLDSCEWDTGKEMCV